MHKNSILISLAFYFCILVTFYFLYQNVLLSILLDGLNFQQKKMVEILFLILFSAVFWSFRLYFLTRNLAEGASSEGHRLKRSEALAQSSTDISFTLNSRGEITSISPMCCGLLGYRQETLISRSFSSLFLKALDYEVIKSQIRNFSVNPHCLQVELVCKDGSHLWAEISTVLQQTKMGIELQGHIQNINQQRIMFAELQSKERILTNIIDNMKYLIFVKDNNKKTILANKFVIDFTGNIADQLYDSEGKRGGKDPLNTMLPSRFIKRQTRIRNYKKELLDSAGILHEASFSQIKIEQGNEPQLTLVIGRLLSASERRAENIEYFLQYDLLTGLLNRNVFINKLDKYLDDLEATSLVAICVVDLSDFKRINDTLGHDIGDQTLKFSAQKISLLSESLTMLCRYNGDEFAFIIEDVSSVEHLELQLERLHQLFDLPLKLHEVDVKLALNIGAVVFPNDGENASVLLKKLDISLHVAKSSGAVRTQLYTGALEESLQANMRIEKCLAHALEKEEFYLVFQPFVNSHSDQLMGAEVLLRWRSEELGEVYPDQFIPIAEQTGDIVAIGSWVIDQACLQLKRWIDRFGDDFYLAVNVSPRQFLYGDLVNVVDNALRTNEINAQALEIEITEGLLISDQALVLKTMQALHQHGVRLSLDDFGTGYSSLNYLKNFPFDCLKIDRSFITDLNSDKQNDALVVAITEMAHALNLSVVAEGVEELEQLSRLKILTVDIIQGYYFSKPLRCNDFECWHEQNKGNHFLARIER